MVVEVAVPPLELARHACVQLLHVARPHGDRERADARGRVRDGADVDVKVRRPARVTELDASTVDHSHFSAGGVDASGADALYASSTKSPFPAPPPRPAPQPPAPWPKPQAPIA